MIGYFLSIAAGALSHKLLSEQNEPSADKKLAAKLTEAEATINSLELRLNRYKMRENVTVEAECAALRELYIEENNKRAATEAKLAELEEDLAYVKENAVNLGRHSERSDCANSGCKRCNGLLIRLS